MSDYSSGGVSRRTLLKAGVAAITVGFAARTAAQQKIAPTMVQYQPDPKDGKQCNQCIQWVEPNGCKVVEGEISPTGWCAVWAPKA